MCFDELILIYTYTRYIKIHKSTTYNYTPYDYTLFVVIFGVHLLYVLLLCVHNMYVTHLSVPIIICTSYIVVLHAVIPYMNIWM